MGRISSFGPPRLDMRGGSDKCLLGLSCRACRLGPPLTYWVSGWRILAVPAHLEIWQGPYDTLIWYYMYMSIMKGTCSRGIPYITMLHHCIHTTILCLVNVHYFPYISGFIWLYLMVTSLSTPSISCGSF